MNVRVLFLDGRDGSSSRMAAALARRRATPGVAISQAMLEPGTPDPLVAEVMAENGWSLNGEPDTTLADMAGQEYDLVIALCAQAAAQLPLLLGRPAVVIWRLPEPAQFAVEPAVRRMEFRKLRDMLQQLVADLFEQGYVQALAALRVHTTMIVESMSDGLLVHDMQRRIVLFNRAAEAITGRRRQDVVGHDCHQIFGCGFCGGKCVLGTGTEPGFTERRDRMEITTTEGESRTLDALIRPLHALDGRWVGVAALFHDVTREFALARRVGEMQSFAGIIGRDGKMQEVFDLIRDVANSAVPILLRGESGTGKELVAAAIHNEGPRASKPFVAVNCGALPEGLLESELFGHVRGSFTGAIRDKKGRFEIADGGTIFLDEIGDVSPAMQVRLLRVLQEGVIQRVGSEAPVRVDVRVISATHRDLQKEIADARFREDLFYRLNVVPIWLPPLRERLADIPLLVSHLMARFLAEMQRASAVRISPEAMDQLLTYDWPGNVRELQNWLQYALVKCHGDEIRPEHLPPARMLSRMPVAAVVPASRAAPRERLTLARVRAALDQCQGNRREAARALGVARATLYRFFAAQPEGAEGGNPKAEARNSKQS